MFLVPVIAASDSLLLQIVLNSVLLSPTVSGGVRPTPRTNTMRSFITPLFAAVRGSVSVRTPLRGSDTVRTQEYVLVSVF